MSWTAWPPAGAAVPGVVAAPVQPAMLQNTITSAPAVLPPSAAGMQYSPEQWAQMQQQNWQQWAQWQQQYQQWHQQYGAEYQKSMGAMAPVNPPTPAGPNTAIPPPPPNESKPPPPPPPEESQPVPQQYNTIPPKATSGYSTAPPSQYTTGPPPNQYRNANQNQNTWQNTGNKRPYGQAQGSEYDTGKRQMLDSQNQWGRPNQPQQQPPPPPQQQSQQPKPNQWGSQAPAPPNQTHAQKVLNLEELTLAEKKFDKEFAAWEAQFNKWKDQNANHPDKTQYREYEKKWESWRNSLLDRREQMRKKRMALQATMTPTPAPPPSLVTRPAGIGGPAPLFNQPPPAVVPPEPAAKPAAIDMFSKPPPTQNNEPLSFKPAPGYPGEEILENNDGGAGFLKSGSPAAPGGIPGLDLVKDAQGKDVLEEENVDKDAEPDTEQAQALPKGPDLDAISKGINSILGDQKLMNMLSMVSQNQNFSVNAQPKLPEQPLPANAPIPSLLHMAPQAPPLLEQSSHSYDDYRDQYGQREAVNNFDDQTRMSFSNGPNDQEAGYGSNFGTGPGRTRFGGPEGRGNFGGPDGRGNFGGPDGRGHFGGPDGRGNFGGPEGRNNFGGPDGRNNFGGPKGRNDFGGSEGRSNFGGPKGRNDFGGLEGRNDFGGPKGRNDFGVPEGRSDFGGPKGRNDFGGPEGRNDFGGPKGRNDLGVPEGRSDFSGPKGRNDFGGPESRNDFGGPKGRNDSGGPGARNDFGGPGVRNDFGGPESRNDFGGPRGRIDIGGPKGRNDFGGSEGRGDFGGSEGRNDFGGPKGRNEFGGPEGRNDFGGPKGRNDFGGSEGRSSFGGPKDRNDFGRPEGRNDFGEPKGRNDFGGPEDRKSFDRNFSDGGSNRSNQFDRFNNFDGPDNRQNQGGSFNRGRDDKFNKNDDYDNYDYDEQGYGGNNDDQYNDDYNDNYNDNYNEEEGYNNQEDYQNEYNEEGWNENEDEKFHDMFNEGEPNVVKDTPEIVEDVPEPPEIVPPEEEEPLFVPQVVVDYEHKCLKPPEPEINLEPIRMFDYRHKPVNRIPYPQRPIWLTGELRNVRQFDPMGAGRFMVDRPIVFERPPPFERDANPPRDRYPPDRDDRFSKRGGFDGDRGGARGSEGDRFKDAERGDRYPDNRFERRQDTNRDYNRNRNRHDETSRNRDHGDRDRDTFKSNNTREKDKSSRPQFETKKLDLEELSDDDWEENNERKTSPKKGGLKFSPPRDRKRESPDITLVANPTNPGPVPRQVNTMEDIINAPGRFNRPSRIVIILRGPPGSGKTYLAKLIKDREVENGGSAPRILSLDDYFMVEHEKEVMEDGKKVKVKEMVYEYEAEMEESYRQSLTKSFKKTITDGYFNFIVVDNVNDKVKNFGEMWSFAKQNGFQVYVCQMDLDPQLCTSRNIHNRNQEDIEDCIAGWEPTPSHHPMIDATNFLQSAGPITEVEMEEVDLIPDDKEEDAEDQVRSKWDAFDCSVNNLARLDGVNKPLRHSRTMEEYLQLDDEWEEPSEPSKPGQKRVRWADLEEQRQQKKMKALGFVVGQTDWKRMMDPSGGESALTQTKYIERVRRF